MLNLQINKPLLKSIDSELSEDDKAKLAVFISNFKAWNKQYEIFLEMPVTYLQVEALKEEIEKTLPLGGDDADLMLEKAISAIKESS